MALHFLDLEKLSLTFLESSVFLSILCVGFDEILVCFQLSLFPLIFDFQTSAKLSVSLVKNSTGKYWARKGLEAAMKEILFHPMKLYIKHRRNKSCYLEVWKNFYEKQVTFSRRKRSVFLLAGCAKCWERIKKRGGICNSDGGVGVENVVCDCKQDVVWVARDCLGHCARKWQSTARRALQGSALLLTGTDQPLQCALGSVFCLGRDQSSCLKNVINISILFCEGGRRKGWE